MRGLLREQGLEHAVAVDPAGTGAWHAGAPPDARATAAALRRGVDAGRRRPRRRARRLRRLRPDPRRRRAQPARAARGRARRGAGRLHLLREFDPASDGAPDRDVPDPYYGGADGFEHVLDLVEAACRGLLDALRADGRL